MVAQKENSQARLLKRLSDQQWRLNNLYWILTEQGEKVKFKLNAVQMILYLAMWWLNVIPKSRQHGITTFIAIFMLDACLFNSNVRAGIIAHKLEDAKKIFRDKVKFAFDNLPYDLRAERSLPSGKLPKDDTMEILFTNNSGIYVATSMRSGTLQYLHVSEYGWLCAHAPAKAKEVKSGAMETVHEGGILFIESTAEGSYGDFYDICMAAQKLQIEGKPLGKMDFKIHTFPWYQKESNQTDPDFVIISEKSHKYFDKIERICNKKISLPQRAWYVAKKNRLKHDMLSQHPSTLEEAFEASVEGAYFAEEMAFLRDNGRIIHVPFLDDRLVHTVCDLGLGANMPWIFFQIVGLEVHIINTFCMSKRDDPTKGMAFYRKMLDEYSKKYGYSYGKHFCPFDIKKGEIGIGQAIYDTALQMGIKFEILDKEGCVVDGIERMRTIFHMLYIDSDLCQPLLRAWASYHREWIEGLGKFADTPKGDQSSHFADAGRYLSDVIKNELYKGDDEASITAWQRLKAEHA